MSPRQTFKSAMRKALLAEAKAWREAAERMDRPPLHFLRTHIAHMAGGHGSFVWIPDPSITPTISREVFRAMRHRLYLHSVMARAAMPMERGFRSTRVLAALFLALEAEDEAKALSSQSPKGGRRG